MLHTVNIFVVGLNNADQRITEDVEKFAFAISELYSYTFKVSEQIISKTLLPSQASSQRKNSTCCLLNPCGLELNRSPRGANSVLAVSHSSLVSHPIIFLMCLLVLKPPFCTPACLRPEKNPFLQPLLDVLLFTRSMASIMGKCWSMAMPNLVCMQNPSRG